MENENLINEYINVLNKRVNDLSQELLVAQAKLNLATKEQEGYLAQIETLKQDIEDSKEEVLRERSKVKEVEVVKEVVKEVEVGGDEKLIKEIGLLKKELRQAENKIERLKGRKTEEIANGGGTQT